MAAALQLALLARRAVRAALKLQDLPPWWERRHAKQKAFQLAIAVNLSLVAIGLPLSWNTVVRQKSEELRAGDAASVSETTAALLRRNERYAVEILVNERRAARGLPPYPYDSQLHLSAESQALFATALSSSSASSSP